MITIVDCGIGNISSVRRMLENVGVESKVTDKPQVLARATKIIIPGVGHFDSVMGALISLDLADLIKNMVDIEKIPVLGICAGMQILCRCSEEGNRPGLGLIDADVVRFEKKHNQSLKIPHMGWNDIQIKKHNALLSDDRLTSRFYFVHSYYVRPVDPEIIIGTANYGQYFCAAFNVNNIYGVQFHPEKSHRFGKNLLKNFSEI